jgi:L,D-transpeptidase YcbB
MFASGNEGVLFYRSMKNSPRLWASIFFALAVARAFAAQAQPADTERLRTIVAQLRGAPTMTIGKATLTNTAAMAAFYERGAMALAWSRPGAASELLRAIRKIEADGLRPADYHLAALEAAIASRDMVTTDVIATDAIIRLIAHMRYGKANPARSNRKWNHPAHLKDTSLDESLDQARAATSLEAVIDRERPRHFVYEGLRDALAKFRAAAATGGWPLVEAGAPIKPGSEDARVPAVRARLRASGDWQGSEAELASSTYDDLLAAAVKRLQALHRLRDDGIIGKATVDAMNASAKARVEQVRVNLERTRWVLGGLGSTFLLVNLPAYKAYLIRNHALAWETRVQIGRAARKTPVIRTAIDTVIINPTWTVPPTILKEDVAPALQADRSYLKRRGLVAVERATGRVVDEAEIDWSAASLADYRFTQPAGQDNALGVVKFNMDNPYAIFLHDTPHREKFAEELRTFSSGCIRVERPLELAARLLEQSEWPMSRIEEAVRAGKTRGVRVEPRMPVVIVYWTVSVGRSGLHIARDVYDDDRQVRAALDAPVDGAVWWPARPSAAQPNQAAKASVSVN